MSVRPGDDHATTPTATPIGPRSDARCGPGARRGGARRGSEGRSMQMPAGGVGQEGRRPSRLRPGARASSPWRWRRCAVERARTGAGRLDGASRDAARDLLGRLLRPVAGPRPRRSAGCGRPPGGAAARRGAGCFDAGRRASAWMRSPAGRPTPSGRRSCPMADLLPDLPAQSLADGRGCERLGHGRPLEPVHVTGRRFRRRAETAAGRPVRAPGRAGRKSGRSFCIPFVVLV